MRTIILRASVALFVLGSAASARAATLQVGSGKPYAKPCDAIMAAKPNDIVEIDPGTYTDTCPIKTQGLTVRGVGGQPKIDVSAGTPSGQKGIYVIDADDVTIENLELTGAHIDVNSGENGAAIRVEGANFTIRGCYIHDNQDGILATPLAPSPLLTVEGNEFVGNGRGNGCDDGNGCTHNIYVSHNNDKVVFQYNWSHKLASDTPDKGHLFKSRAKQSFVLYNRLTGEGDADSYEIDISEGGLAVIVGNMIEKPASAGNPAFIAYAFEGLNNPDNRIFVVNNTFVNDKASGTFINLKSGNLTAHNNLFVGAGTPSSTGKLSADNLATMAPMFVDQANYDYHLQKGSPAIDQGVDPGMADQFSLTPTEEYVHPLKHVARKSDGKLDLGAFEFGTNTMGTGGSGGGNPTGSGGASASSSGSTSSGATSGSGTSTSSGASTGAGGAGNGDTTTKSGCSCRTGDDGDARGGLLVAMAAALAIAGRRKKRG